MRKEFVYGPVSLSLALALVAAVLEIVVRAAIDNGMQFDLEMWKYARDVKQLAAEPSIGHEHRPRARAHLMGVDVATNTLKLRDQERSYERRPGVKRILMLGDSVTFGWGVRAEETFSARLQERFAKAGMEVEVINTGVGNYNTAMEVAYFLAEGHRFSPDVVVLNYFINDAERMPTYQTSSVERWSAGYVYVKSRVDVLLRTLGSRDRRNWEDYYRVLYRPGESSSGWKEAEQAVARLAAFCGARNIPLVVANIPELRRLNPYPFDAESSMVRELAVRANATYIDLLPALRDHEPSTLWVSPPDPHPNGRAHGLIADAMFGVLQRLLNR